MILTAEKDAFDAEKDFKSDYRLWLWRQKYFYVTFDFDSHFDFQFDFRDFLLFWKKKWKSQRLWRPKLIFNLISVTFDSEKKS